MRPLAPIMLDRTAKLKSADAEESRQPVSDIDAPTSRETRWNSELTSADLVNIGGDHDTIRAATSFERRRRIAYRVRSR